MKRKLLLLMSCAVILFTGCGKTEKETSTEKKAKDVEIEINEKENLKLNTYYTGNNELIFDITNIGSEIIDYINIDVAFYNEKGKLIKTDKQYVRNLGANQQNIIKMILAAEYDQDGNSILPDKIEIALNKTIYSSKFEAIYVDKVKTNITKSDVDGQLNLTITNESGETIDDVNAAVVFYKDSKPVDVQVVSFQSVGATVDQLIYVPTVLSNDTYETLKYDDVKVVINNASKYIVQ